MPRRKYTYDLDQVQLTHVKSGDHDNNIYYSYFSENKEQKKKVEKEAIKNQFLEKTETKVKKAIKDLIYMTLDQEQYEVEVEVSE